MFSYDDPNSAWCNASNQTAARVDEIKATTFGGRKSLIVKSVCANFSALPVVYHPQDDSSWGPPYVLGDPAGPFFTSLDTCRAFVRACARGCRRRFMPPGHSSAVIRRHGHVVSRWFLRPLCR